MSGSREAFVEIGSRIAQETLGPPHLGGFSPIDVATVSWLVWQAAIDWYTSQPAEVYDEGKMEEIARDSV